MFYLGGNQLAVLVFQVVSLPALGTVIDQLQNLLLAPLIFQTIADWFEGSFDASVLGIAQIAHLVSLVATLALAQTQVLFAVVYRLSSALQIVSYRLLSSGKHSDYFLDIVVEFVLPSFHFQVFVNHVDVRTLTAFEFAEKETTVVLGELEARLEVLGQIILGFAFLTLVIVFVHQTVGNRTGHQLALLLRRTQEEISLALKTRLRVMIVETAADCLLNGSAFSLGFFEVKVGSAERATSTPGYLQAVRIRTPFAFSLNQGEFVGEVTDLADEAFAGLGVDAAKAILVAKTGDFGHQTKEEETRSSHYIPRLNQKSSKNELALR